MKVKSITFNVCTRFQYKKFKTKFCTQPSLASDLKFIFLCLHFSRVICILKIYMNYPLDYTIHDMILDKFSFSFLFHLFDEFCFRNMYD